MKAKPLVPQSDAIGTETAVDVAMKVEQATALRSPKLEVSATNTGAGAAITHARIARLLRKSSATLWTVQTSAADLSGRRFRNFGLGIGAHARRCSRTRCTDCRDARHRVGVCVCVHDGTSE